MKRTVLILMVGALVAVTALTVSVAAQATRSVNEGIYTAEQAKRGQVIYLEKCAACHGDNLEGTGPMPPLAGQDFLNNWSSKTVGDLFEKTQTTMPATAPGSLTPAEAADVVSHILSAGKYPAGSSELASSAAPLLQIKLDAPK